jgi:NAD(P)-dependent dehydrogenase (short-subunit alcohol dehydrogenase family)
MAETISRAVLITGCSSGIGRATAHQLATHGWTVYATARHLDEMLDLKQAGCYLLQLDVTNEASMQEAIATIERVEGAVGVLINNAGYSQSGAIESVPLELVRRQFETTVFGLMRLTQLVLPGMRKQRWGKIVNISSMGGRLTFPGGGYYHASKFAVEAFTRPNFANSIELRGGYLYDTCIFQEARTPDFACCGAALEYGGALFARCMQQ